MSKHWPLPECFTVRLTMQSDWHIGSGMGRPGNIDRLIARDADGLPFVPGKSLRGIWRDACERLCRGLDDGQRGDWSHLVNRLFGSQPALGVDDPTGHHRDPAQIPLGSTVQIPAARIPSPLRERLLQSDRRLREAMTFVKPGVKIDRRSGAAQTDFLRFEEMARTETVLEAECRLAVPEEMRTLVSALLIASSRLVERLGGKRRRGPGRCCLEIVGADNDGALDWLQNTTSAPAWPRSNLDNEPLGDARQVAANDPWIRVPLRLALQGPLAASYRTVGNVVETLDFLPGSYLLPHITRALSSLGVDIRAALQAGEVCVLPATPEVDGEQGLPVPFALFAPKNGQGLAERDKVVNRLLQPEPADDMQRKQLRDGYVASNPAKVHMTAITVHTHNRVDDQSQRPTGAGGLYSYEAIAPVDDGKPVVLRSEIRLRKSWADRLAPQPQWWKKLDGNISLGRSRKDDYGSVVIKTTDPEPVASAAIEVNTELFVWLVSDTLIRNNQLRPEPTARALGKELSQALGVTLTLRKCADGRLDELVRIRRLDTWHVGWGLPRPSLVALQAGSCVVFQANGEIDSTKLAQLEASGIGERTAEGYGQVRFNHPLMTKTPAVWPPNTQAREEDSAPTAAPIRQNDPAFGFARLLERECWKQEIRRACLAIANGQRKELLGWDHNRDKPPMSQLGGLRGQLSSLRSVADRQRVIGWLDRLAENNRRKDRWPSIPKVKEIIETDARIWGIIDRNGWPTLTEAATDQLRQELWPFAVRCFFDACIRAHKRELEDQQKRKEAISGT